MILNLSFAFSELNGQKLEHNEVHFQRRKRGGDPEGRLGGDLENQAPAQNIASWEEGRAAIALTYPESCSWEGVERPLRSLTHLVT